MSNTNCLEGCRCPKCGQTSHFQVESTAVFDIFDSGTDEFGDVMYDLNSYARCPRCAWEGKWGDLQEQETGK